MIFSTKKDFQRKSLVELTENCKQKSPKGSEDNTVQK